MTLNMITKAAVIRSLSLAIAVLAIMLVSSTTRAQDSLPNLDADSAPQYKRLYNLATNGSAEAQYELGLMFEYGQGVDQDDATAVYWYEQSAAQLFVDATYRLAVLNDNGWGLPTNKGKAIDLYKTAAEKGHQLAQHDLAIMYFHGNDAPKNLLEAYKWLKIAVVSGSPLMQKHLSRVADEMSSDEIAVAEFLANEWLGRSEL